MVIHELLLIRPDPPRIAVEIFSCYLLCIILIKMYGGRDEG